MKKTLLILIIILTAYPIFADMGLLGVGLAAGANNTARETLHEIKQLRHEINALKLRVIRLEQRL